MKISSLYLYPIKSCAGILVPRLSLGFVGPKHDRVFALCDPEGNFLSQRAYPKMAMIRTSLVRDVLFSHDQSGYGLVVEMDGHEKNLVLLDDGEVHDLPHFPKVDIRIHNDICPGIDLGRNHAEWFSDALGTKCRLIRQVSRFPRRRDSSAAGGEIVVSFADSYPLLAVSEASVQKLNEHLTAAGLEKVTHHRFRPNIVITDCEPHIEDVMGLAEIGTAKLLAVKQCARCTIVNTDQDSGERTVGKDGPLAFLAKYRRVGGGVMFGMNCLVNKPGEIATGDEVKMLRE